MVSQAIDVGRIEHAIAEAERGTSGEVRVSVAPFFWGSVRAMADRAFVRLGMHRTRHRNAVLFLVVPRRRRFVVLGDVGVHQKVGQATWDSIARGLERRCRDGDLTSALEEGIHELAGHLATHFPLGEQPDDELPNDVDLPRARGGPSP